MQTKLKNLFKNFIAHAKRVEERIAKKQEKEQLIFNRKVEKTWNKLIKITRGNK